MTGQKSATARARRPACRVGTVLALIAVASLAGCSSVPDAVNPVEWYRGVAGWVSGEEEEKAAEPERPIPGADQPFPSLSSVPERPNVSTQEERRQAAARLAADREEARYTDQRIRLQSDAAARPSPPPTPPAQTPPASAVISSPMPEQEPPPEPPRAEAPLPGQQTAAVPDSPPEPPRYEPSPPAAVAPSPDFESPPPQPSITPPPAMQAPGWGGTAQVPGGAMAFGPAPSDIAVARQGAAATAGGGMPAEAIGEPGFRSTRSPFSPRFPAGVSAGRSPPGTGSGMPGAGGIAGAEEIATVHFAVGSSQLDAAARRAVREAAERYKARGGTLYVVGHASSRTRNMPPVRHHMVNFQVSLDRANAVTRELVRQGIDGSAIVAMAMSDSEPEYLEVMPAGEAGNRRAVIMLGD